MKFFIFSLVFICSNVFAEIISIYTPLEAESISVEYSDASKQGIIRVVNCSPCTKKLYNFSSSVLILKNGQTFPLEKFLEEYWKAKYPTIFLDQNTNTIIRISY